MPYIFAITVKMGNWRYHTQVQGTHRHTEKRLKSLSQCVFASRQYVPDIVYHRHPWRRLRRPLR